MKEVKVRSKPIETVAWQYTGDTTDMPDWVRKHDTSRNHAGINKLYVTNFGRSIRVNPGYWLIRAGNTFSIKSDAAFRNHYDVLEN